eukprot:Lankesteria_metandrocarpae@DN2643_c0_g1_i1.p1
MTTGRMGTFTAQLEIVHNDSLRGASANNSTAESDTHEIESVVYQFTDMTRGGILWQWHRLLNAEDNGNTQDLSALCFDAALTQTLTFKASADTKKITDTILVLDDNTLTAASVGRGVTGVNKASAGRLWTVDLSGNQAPDGDAAQGVAAQSETVVKALTALHAQNARYCTVVVDPVSLHTLDTTADGSGGTAYSAYVLGSVTVANVHAWIAVEVNLPDGQVLSVMKFPQMLGEIQPTASMLWDARHNTKLSVNQQPLTSSAKATVVDRRLLSIANNGNLYVAELSNNAIPGATQDADGTATAFNLKAIIAELPGLSEQLTSAVDKSADWRIINPSASHASYRGLPCGAVVLCNGSATAVIQLVSATSVKIVTVLLGRWTVGALTSLQQFPTLNVEGYIPSDTKFALAGTHAGHLQVVALNVADGKTSTLLELKAIRAAERGSPLALTVAEHHRTAAAAHDSGVQVVASFGDHSLISVSNDNAASEKTVLHWIREEGLASTVSVLDFHVSRSRIREILGSSQSESPVVSNFFTLSSWIPRWIVDYIPYLLEFEAVMSMYQPSPLGIVNDLVETVYQAVRTQLSKYILTTDPQMKLKTPKRTLDPLFIPLRDSVEAELDIKYAAEAIALMESTQIATSLQKQLSEHSDASKLTDPLRIAILSSCSGKVFAIHLATGQLLWWRTVMPIGDAEWPSVGPSSFCLPTIDIQPRGVSASINGRASTNLGYRRCTRRLPEIKMVDSKASRAPTHRQEPQSEHEDHHRKLMAVSSFFDNEIGTYRLKAELLDPLTGGVETVHTFLQDVEKVIPLLQNASTPTGVIDTTGTQHDTTGTGLEDGASAMHWRPTMYLLLKSSVQGGVAELFMPESGPSAVVAAGGYLSAVVLYDLDVERSTLTGLQYEVTHPEHTTDAPFVPLNKSQIWQLNFKDSGETVISVTPFQHSDFDHVPAIIHGANIDVLHRYINANLLAVLTRKLSPESSAVQVSLQVVNTVDGAVLLSQPLPDGATTPMQVLAVDNSITIRLFNLNNRRQELWTVDMYYPYKAAGPWQILSGLCTDSFAQLFGRYGARLKMWMRYRGVPTSLTEAMTADDDHTQNMGVVRRDGVHSGLDLAVPRVLTRMYVFPGSIHQMGITTTKQGVTPRLLIMALPGGQVHSLPYKMLLAHRRTADTSAKSMQAAMAEDGVPPYVPVLPKIAGNALSYSHQVMHVRGVASYPGTLESTTTVLVFGLDLFYRATQPAKGFDGLSAEFNRVFLMLSVVALFTAAVVTSRMAKTAKLNRSWA